MAKVKLDKEQYVGMTETGDPAFNLDIFDRLYKANIIITKRLNYKLVDKLIENKDKIILHCTVTGMGRSKIEPMVPYKETTHKKLSELIDRGFPVEQIVLRIDPVIPTEKGIKTAPSVIELFKDLGIKRVRISFLDMYKHTKERFSENNIPLPYKSFHASLGIRLYSLQIFKDLAEKYNFDLEVCGEPDIESIPCLSQKDIDILGLTDEITLIGSAEQRSSCGCAGNKIQLIKGGFTQKCGNGCLYCYIKDK